MHRVFLASLFVFALSACTVGGGPRIVPQEQSISSEMPISQFMLPETLEAKQFSLGYNYGSTDPGNQTFNRNDQESYVAPDKFDEDFHTTLAAGVGLGYGFEIGGSMGSRSRFLHIKYQPFGEPLRKSKAGELSLAITPYMGFDDTYHEEGVREEREKGLFDGIFGNDPPIVDTTARITQSTRIQGLNLSAGVRPLESVLLYTSFFNQTGTNRSQASFYLKEETITQNNELNLKNQGYSTGLAFNLNPNAQLIS